jgi:hypothetical protein
VRERQTGLRSYKMGGIVREINFGASGRLRLPLAEIIVWEQFVWADSPFRDEFSVAVIQELAIIFALQCPALCYLEKVAMAMFLV